MNKNIVYGAGIYGELFCNELERNGILIDCFVDQFTEKTHLSGKKIKRLADINLENTNIYVSITSPIVEKDLCIELSKLTNLKVYSFIDTLNKYPSVIEKCLILSDCWYSEDKSKMLDYEKVNSFKTLLKDEKSIELLDKIIKFRETLDVKYYMEPDLEPQYFPSGLNLFNNQNNIRFIDGGAYNGDTLESSIIEFKKLKKDIDIIVSFEPDISNIIDLNNEVYKQKRLNSNIDFLVYPCGLWSSNEVLSFNNNSNTNSSIVREIGDNKIQIMTVSLDDTVYGIEPNYIKLDIEGAELNAIKGMKKIIKDYNPCLAICLYHKPEDLWEIPLLINQINPNYDMHIRIYGSMGLELVLYCVPKDNKCLN